MGDNTAREVGKTGPEDKSESLRAQAPLPSAASDTMTTRAGYDIVGDVHGMIATFRGMLDALGYRRESSGWSHPAGRNLISVGDLLSRGPDSFGCVELMRELVHDGVGEMVLGNHELNVLHFEAGLRPDTPENRQQIAAVLRQIDAHPREWEDIRAFIRSRPLRLVLDGGRLRVVHACWRAPEIDLLPESLEEADMLVRTAPGGDLREAVEICVKGPLEPCEPFDDGRRLRRTRRIPWWRDHPADAPFVAFGHYLFPWQDERDTPRQPALLGPGRNAVCLDWNIGREGPLVACRHPEQELVILPCRDDTADRG